MKNNLYEAEIQWLDTKETANVLFSDGDISTEDDDDIFFYIKNEEEFEYLKKEGINDFIVLNYYKLNN